MPSLHGSSLRFTKMHGNGNDFVVVDAIHQRVEPTPALCRYLADRHFGIGADQLLWVEQSSTPGVDFTYRIFNADGGEVEQCGNGARAFFQFVHGRGLTHKSPLRVATMKGVIELSGDSSGVRVDMGAPRFAADDIPFVPQQAMPLPDGRWRLALPASALTSPAVDMYVLSMGNPHAVMVVEGMDDGVIHHIGTALQAHPVFPERVNVGFMQVLDRHRIALRVFERGVGETLSCGTGACAAVVAGIKLHLLDSPVQVETRGGLLDIAWQGAAVVMTGTATTVFEGEIELPADLNPPAAHHLAAGV